jgi:two-component system response regulator
MKVLMVEDDPDDVELTMELMESSKIKISLEVRNTAEDAIEFLEKLKIKDDMSSFPDLILLDLNLPKMNGKDLLKRVREDPDLKHIPIVILTSSEQEADMDESYSLGASCYITKPVDITQFAKVVNSINDFWFTIVKYPKKGSL